MRTCLLATFLRKENLLLNQFPYLGKDNQKKPGISRAFMTSYSLKKTSLISSSIKLAESTPPEVFQIASLTS